MGRRKHVYYTYRPYLIDWRSIVEDDLCCNPFWPICETTTINDCKRERTWPLLTWLDVCIDSSLARIDPQAFISKDAKLCVMQWLEKHPRFTERMDWAMRYLPEILEKQLSICVRLELPPGVPFSVRLVMVDHEVSCELDVFHNAQKLSFKELEQRLGKACLRIKDPIHPGKLLNCRDLFVVHKKFVTYMQQSSLNLAIQEAGKEPVVVYCWARNWHASCIVKRPLVQKALNMQMGWNEAESKQKAEDLDRQWDV